MQAANAFLTFLQGIITTMMGWGTSFFGTILPGGAATDEKKSQFMKWGLILAGIYFLSQILRINLSTGGGGGGKKS